MQLFTGSWKTGWLGILAVISAVITGIAVPLLDGNPATSANFEIVIPVVLAGFGVYQARDDDKTSEDVGAGEKK